MDAETFLDNFSTIAEAPGGVQRLRDLLLDLAVTGRLVDQDPRDEPATVGLRSVHAEKGGTLANSIRGGASPLRVPTDSERGGRLPMGWSMARLDDTGEYVNGLAFKNSDWRPAGIPIIRIQNLTNPAAPFNYAVGPFPEDRMAHDGDILVSWSATLEAFRWHRGNGIINQHIFKVIPDERVVTTNYLFHLLRHSIRAMAASEAAHGLVMKHINRGPFLSYVAAIPPLAEQERIVAKVHHLFALCDELEARQQYRDRATTRFRGSALCALTEGKNPDDVSRAWERLSTNWPALTNVPDGIRHLRETLVQLAVEGRLTRRAPTDGSAKRIIESARGQALDQPQLVNSEGDVLPEPYDIPLTWRWVALGGVTANILAGWSAPSTQQVRSGDEWAVLKVSACSWGEFRSEENKGLQPGVVPKEELEVKPGDFLISRANTSDLVARSVVVEATPPRLVLSDKTLRITPVDGCNARYLNLANLAPTARAHYRAEATGTSDSMKNVSQRAIRRTPIPLPPRAEQDRIVAAVDRLNRRCDDLERALERQSNIASQLSASITP